MSAKLLTANLKHLRLVANKSQAKLSIDLELELKRYAKWEEGRSQPDIDNLIAIARLHKITLDDLLTRDLTN